MSIPAKWTVMVYMAGDNDLSSAGDRDLVEMRRIGSTDRLNVVVEFDNAGARGTRRIQVQKYGVNEAVESLGETDSGSPDVLDRFIEWSAQHFPAQRYALILWNHGGGWAPIEVERIARSVHATDFSSNEAAERSTGTLGRAFFRSTLQSILSLDSPSERAICSDDGSGHSLDTLELGRVLARAAGHLGQPVDLLGMDACLMSNVEVAYQLRESVRYVVASEDTEPAAGWPYERVLALFDGQSDAATRDIAGGLVDAYVASYEGRQFQGNVTQTALDVAHVDRLALAIDDLAQALIANMAEHYPVIWQAQRKSTRFAGNTLWDVGHFCAQLARRSADPRVVACATAVVEAHAPGEGRPVVACEHLGSALQHCHGTSVYLVPPMKDISRYYADLDFAMDHRWLSMLRAYHEV